MVVVGAILQEVPLVLHVQAVVLLRQLCEWDVQAWGLPFGLPALLQVALDSGPPCNVLVHHSVACHNHRAIWQQNAVALAQVVHSNEDSRLRAHRQLGTNLLGYVVEGKAPKDPRQMQVRLDPKHQLKRRLVLSAPGRPVE